MDTGATSDRLAGREPRPIFRPLLGTVCVLGGLGGVFALYAFPIPGPNTEALLLALGIILGWGSAVVQSEYGASSTGRKLNEATVRAFEKQVDASESAMEAPQGRWEG